MLKKIYSILPMVVFLTFLAVMSVLLFALPHKEYSEHEKRNLSGFPEVTVEGILKGSVQKDLESFTSDQIPGRNFFVGMNAYWNLITGRNGAQDIYHCDQDYLINAPKPANDQVFQGNLSRFDQFAAQIGIPADFIMVPSGGYLMDQVLPCFHKDYLDDMLYEQAKEHLNHVQLIDVREVLKWGTTQQQVCYRTDHHLTSYGNYLIYRTYQTAHQAPYLSKDFYEVSVHDGFYGTTWSGSGYWKTPPDQVEVWDSGIPVRVTLQDSGKETVVSDSLFFPEHFNQLDQYPVFLDGNHSLVTIESPCAHGGNILLVRDSYAHCLSTFLAANYKTIYLVDLRYYRDSLSEFLASHPVDRMLYLYGVDNLLTDTNSAWLR